MSVVEVTTFTLAPGADVEAFLRSDRRVQTELIPNRPGFLRRTTARRDGDWAVVVLWFSEANATDYEAATRGHPVREEFDRLVEGASRMTHRYDTLD